MNLLDLTRFARYSSSIQKMRLLSISIHERLPNMKLVIRIIALSVVIAGGVAAASTSKTAPVVPSHQSATASMPFWICGGHMACEVNPSGN
jgi:hypothetical protein